MTPYASILLRLNANVAQYTVTVSDGCHTWRKRVSSRQESLCVCSSSPCIRVVATALQNGASTSLYFWLNTGCGGEYDLYFPFPQRPTPAPVTTKTFTLTDAAYGLPIDGTLTFTQNQA